MKKQTVISFIAVLLVLCMLPVLGGCRLGQAPGGQGDNTAAASGTGDGVGDGTGSGGGGGSGELTPDGAYLLVRSASAGSVEKKITGKLYSALEDFCGQLEVRTDDNLSEDETASNLILLGETARPESRLTFESEGDFTVRRVGDNLVIGGGSALALDYACVYFTSYVQQNGLSFPENFRYDGKAGEGEEKYVLIADQGSGKVSLYDLSGGYVPDTPIWSVRAAYSAVAGMKVRKTTKYGTVVAVCSGTSGSRTGTMELFTYTAGKRVWKTTLTAYNPHSVEVSPDGAIAAAASSEGNEVRFFSTRDESGATYASVSFADAHGVLYDPELQCYWVIGSNRLAAYSAAVGADGKVTVSAVAGKAYTIPSGGAHDLQPVAGENRLWVTTHATVYQFDKDTGTFSAFYDGAGDFNQANVKGISSFRDGTVCEIVPDGDLYDWTANSVLCSYLLPFSGETLVLQLALPTNVHAYKVRAFISDYIY